MYLLAPNKGTVEDLALFALRPELTAPVVRAAIEHGMLTGQSDCVRLYYNSARNYRYEKPQKGRLREFNQFGTELLGSSDSLADAETIAFAISVYRKLGLDNFKVRLNTLASPSARSEWREQLVPFLKDNFGSLSADSQYRVLSNPIRILDSKLQQDREVIAKAPSLQEFLTPDDRSHFDNLKLHLMAMGIKYEVDPHLVRGLDYYTRTVFEITSSDLGSQDALCGGGRYDNLVEQLGGPPTPAVGFAAGVERLIIALEKRFELPDTERIKYYIAAREDISKYYVIALADKLRAQNALVTYDLNNRSLKSQLKDADRKKAKYFIQLGGFNRLEKLDEAIDEKNVDVREMGTGKQQELPRVIFVDVTGPDFYTVINGLAENILKLDSEFIFYNS